MYLFLLKLVVHGHGRVHAPNHMPRVRPCVVAFVAFENADKFSVYVPDFIEVSCARAWTRQAPWYVPCASAACILCCEFAACESVSMC